MRVLVLPILMIKPKKGQESFVNYKGLVEISLSIEK